MVLETMSLEYTGPAAQVAHVTLRRPEVLNCINEQWLRDFGAALDSIAERRPRVVVIRGAGRAFCSGIDLTALAHGEIGEAFFRDWELALRRLESLDSLIIAGIHSYCIGGGLQLALACDFRVARADARFGVTAATEGIIPGMGVWRIARYAGVGRAKRLALAADVVDAPVALQWGLVDYVEPPDAFDAMLAGLSERLAEMPRVSTRCTKQLINSAFDSGFDESLETFCAYQRQAVASDDHRRAMAERRDRRERARAKAADVS